MNFKGILVAVVVGAAWIAAEDAAEEAVGDAAEEAAEEAVGDAAEDAAEDAQELQQKEGDIVEQAKFLLATLDNNQSVTISSDGAWFIGLMILGISVAVVAIIIPFIWGKKEPEDYPDFTSYGVPPAYPESSYAVHRTLEEAATKYQKNSVVSS